MGIFELTFRVAWENSRHLATLQLVSPPNDVWETSAEIPYWWRVTIKIWVMLLIGRATWEIWFNQSQAPPRSWEWRVVSLESLRSFIKRHLEGKPMEASPNVSCFLWPLSMFFFLPFSPASFIESCSFWHGLKHLFTLHKLADKVVLDR